jgi:hypothetical protein
VYFVTVQVEKEEELGNGSQPGKKLQLECLEDKISDFTRITVNQSTPDDEDFDKRTEWFLVKNSEIAKRIKDVIISLPKSKNEKGSVHKGEITAVFSKELASKTSDNTVDSMRFLCDKWAIAVDYFKTLLDPEDIS